MAQSLSTLVSLACQTVGAPGFGVQAGQFLNMILQELAQTYDLEVERGFYTFNFNPSLINNSGPFYNGGGPYPLPSDYLRAEPNDVFWVLNGVPYVMINIDLAEFDSLVQQPNNQSYPYWYATDLSQSPPVMYVYQAPNGAYPVYMRYKRQLPDVANPQSSTGASWFPNDNYIYLRLCEFMCRLVDDARAQAFGADAMQTLDRFLKMEGDRLARAETVHLDRRRFGKRYSSLPNTKLVGW